MSFPVWVNGSELGCVDPADRGLAYGDGLFETIRVAQGRALLLEGHIGRLVADAAVLGINFDEAGLCDEYARFLGHCPDSCITKILVTRGCGGRGYLPDPCAPATIIFSSHPPLAHPVGHQVTGINAGICSLQLALQPMLAGIKHLNRLEQVLLRREMEELQVDEALVCDARGYVIEGVFSNVFMVSGGKLHTPAIETAGVRGVMRAAILRQAEQDGVPAEQGLYLPSDFLAADEIFFCNSVNGVWPVRMLVDRHFSPGPVSRRWQAFWQEKI
jgi:4-amino-4-deoxychorismate lyase